MKRFAKIPALVMVLAGAVLALPAAAQTPSPSPKERKPKPAKTTPGGPSASPKPAKPAKAAKAPASGEAAPAASPDATPRPISIPIPTGQTVKGIKIPYFDLEGRLRMQFHAEEALRLDEQSVQFARLTVEMKEGKEGDENLFIDLPASKLDLTTQVITSADPVTIRRSDFSLEGETMEFDTRTRRGVLRGKVRMQIFDRKKL